MSRYPMTEIIATREYTLTASGRETPLVVRIGKPEPFPDAPPGDFYCPFTIESSNEVRHYHAGGLDSLQALVLAISKLRIILRTPAPGEQITYLGEDSLGLDLVG